MFSIWLIISSDMGSLLVETDKVIDKIRGRNMATKLLKASDDERELTSIEKRLAQMSQRATFQILVIFVLYQNRYWHLSTYLNLRCSVRNKQGNLILDMIT